MSIIDALKSRGTKIGGSIIGGAGVLTLALNLMNEKIDKVSTDIDGKETHIMQVIEYKHQSVLTELKHLSDQQKEMRIILEKIDQRVYELNRKRLYSDKFFEEDGNKNN